MKLIKPERLQKHDLIGLISPSDSLHRRHAGLMRGIKILRKMGFGTKLGKNALKEKYHMAGSDEERASDLNEMFENSEVKAIICTDGGSAAYRILRLIDYRTIKKNPKIFVGLSDITLLHSAINRKSNLVTFHGPLVIHGINSSHLGYKKGMEPYTKEYFLKALTQSKPIGRIRPSSKWNLLKEGNANGRLVGGLLRLIENILGTEFEPEFKNSIFFLEEYQQHYARIERSLIHLKEIGAFEKIKGMIIGHLEQCTLIHPKYTLEKIIRDLLDEYDFPVLKIEEIGHNTKNITIPIGVKAQIVDNRFSITESGVK